MTLEDGHWAKISTWQHLQWLVNDLVFYESQGAGIIPSNPNIGADGGWDGKFTGTLYGITGIHMLQAKRKSGTPAQAFQALKQDLSEEIDKAIAAGAKHLVVATNADLTADHVTDLEATARKTLSSLTVWGRARLSQCLQRHPGLLARHFGIGQISLLCVPSEHFSKNEASLTDESLQPDPIARIVDGATQSFGTLHLLHGIGGTGKSHVLRLIAQRLVAQPNTIVRVISGCRGASLIEDVSVDLLLDASSRVVLLLDDAERFPGSLLEQLATLVRRDSRFHAVVTCRTVAVESCRTRMGVELRVPFTLHEVPALSESDLVTFVSRLAPTHCPEAHEVRAAIRQFRGVPYLLKLWAEAHEIGGLSPEQIRNVFSVIVSKCTRSCRSVLDGLIQEPKQSRLLGAIAASTPFLPDSGAAINAVASVSSCTTDDVSLAISKLEQGGVLRRVGRSLRFNPDTVGDLLFTQEMRDDGFQRLVIEHCLPLNPAGLIASVAAAGNWGNTSTAGQVAATILNSWRQDLAMSAWWNAQDRFRQVAQICLLAPVDALALCRAHLESAGSLYRPDDDPDRRGLLGAFRNVDDTLGILGRRGLQREGILGLLAEVASQFSATARKPLDDLVTKLFRPLRGPVRLMVDDLRRLSAEIRPGKEGDLSAWIAVKACSEVLASAHEDNFSDERSYTIRTRALADSPGVRELRSSAIEVLSSLVKGERFTDAIAVAESIGESRGMPPIGDVDALPLGPLFHEERDTFLSMLDHVDLSRWGLSDLHSLDQLMLQWWANQQSEGLSSKVLQRIPRTIAYRLFTRLVNHMPIEDFSEVIDVAPADQRWRWLIDHFSLRGTAPDPEDERLQDQLADLLRVEYQTPDQATNLLVLISNNMAKVHNSAWGDRTLSLWVKKAPDCFAAALRLTDWTKINHGLRQVVDATLASSHPTAFTESTQAVVETQGRNTDVIDRFLRGLVSTSPPLEPLSHALLLIAQNPDARVRYKLLFSCRQSGLSSMAVLREEIVLACLDTGFDNSLFSPISWLFEIRGGEDFDPLPASIWSKIMAGLENEESLPHDVAYVFATVTKKSPDFYIDLIGRRISKARELAEADNGFRFRPFPDTSSGWVDIQHWEPSHIDAYLGMLASNRDSFGEWWHLHDAFDVFEVQDALPTAFVDALIRDLDGSDQVRSSIAREILLHTNAGRSIGANHVRSVCRHLVTSGERDQAVQWLHRWEREGFGVIGEDGVRDALLETITLMKQLKDQESDFVLKSLFSEVLADHERQRDRIREQHQEEES